MSDKKAVEKVIDLIKLLKYLRSEKLEKYDSPMAGDMIAHIDQAILKAEDLRSSLEEKK